jgi:hypothetical protein
MWQRYKLDVIGDRRKPMSSRRGDMRVLVDGRCERLEKPEQLGAGVRRVRQVLRRHAGALWDRPFDASFGWNEILKGRQAHRHALSLQKMNLSPVQRVALEAYLSGCRTARRTRRRTSR